MEVEIVNIKALNPGDIVKCRTSNSVYIFKKLYTKGFDIEYTPINEHNGRFDSFLGEVYGAPHCSLQFKVGFPIVLDHPSYSKPSSKILTTSKVEKMEILFEGVIINE